MRQELTSSRKSLPKDKKISRGAIISILIQPRASKNELIVKENKEYKVRLTAPPVDGAANEALINFLSATLAVAKSQIEIVSGHTARKKIIRVHGISDFEVKRALNKEIE